MAAQRKPKGKPVYDYDVCVACGICMHACAFDAIALSKTGVDKIKTVYPELTQPDKCISCGQCEMQCPTGAVVLK